MFKPLKGDDLVRLNPGAVVYDDKGDPLVVKGVHWFGDYDMDIVDCTNGKSYPGTSLSRLVAG